MTWLGKGKVVLILSQACFQSKQIQIGIFASYVPLHNMDAAPLIYGWTLLCLGARGADVDYFQYNVPMPCDCIPMLLVCMGRAVTMVEQVGHMPQAQI